MPASHPRRFSVAPPAVRPWLCATAVLAVGGCNLFEEGVDLLRPGGYDLSAADDPKLSPLRPTIDQITLEVTVAQRPADDPLLGEALWLSVSEFGAIDTAVHERVRAAGFRVGVTGGSPPDALLRLTGKTDEVGEPLPGRDRLTDTRTVPMRAGTDAVLKTTDDAAPVTFAAADGTAEEFADARCVLRVRCRTPRDRWAEFEFTPEVHHGAVGLQPVSTDHGVTTTYGQKVHALAGCRFTLPLMAGDSVIIGRADDAAPDSPAAKFFTAERDGARTDRLLVVKLTNIRPIEGVRQERKTDGLW